MDKLRVFLSSTCYDLKLERTAIEKLLTTLGHQPIRSDKNAIRYDPDKSTHSSCLDNVEKRSDYLIMIIHSRFGGSIFREAFDKHINTKCLKTKSQHVDYFNKSNKFSISQCEALKAIEKGIPHLIFIHESVTAERKRYTDLIKANADISKHTFLNNKDAVHIFEFISFINNLDVNNGTYEYKTIGDLKKVINSALSDHFRQLLEEKRHSNVSDTLITFPSELSRFHEKLLDKLASDYKKQKAIISVDNKLVFDSKCNCTYSLTVNIKPLSDYPVYYFQITPDKMGAIDLKKFKDASRQTDDNYIGFTSKGKLHLFLFRKPSNNRASFTVELELYVSGFLSDLITENKGTLSKVLHDENKKYEWLNQTIVFPKDAFKNLKVICKELPDNRKKDELLRPRRTGNNIIYELKLEGKSLKNKKDPTIRIEITRD